MGKNRKKNSNNNYSFTDNSTSDIDEAINFS